MGRIEPVLVGRLLVVAVIAEIVAARIDGQIRAARRRLGRIEVELRGELLELAFNRHVHLLRCRRDRAFGRVDLGLSKRGNRRDQRCGANACKQPTGKFRVFHVCPEATGKTGQAAIEESNAIRRNLRGGNWLSTTRNQLHRISDECEPGSAYRTLTEGTESCGRANRHDRRNDASTPPIRA